MSIKEQKEIATVMLVLDDNALAADVNHILHDFADFIIVRCGVPCRERGTEIINIVIEADDSGIKELLKKLNKISGVYADAIISPI